MFWFFKKTPFLSNSDENRINDNNDKMCLFHLEYLMGKTIFNKLKKRLNQF
jgi:hypothetical protein